MRRFKAESGKRRAEPRQATTLAEVLVSIMILSIGLISLAALFPIAILRSVQATQLTNAAILSVNAETYIDISPEIVFNPDGDDPTVVSNLLEHFRNTNTRNYIVDPLGWNLATSGKNEFGAPLDPARPTDRLPRFPGLPQFDETKPIGTPIGATAALSNAVRAVTLPDSWVDQEVTGPGTLATSGSAPNFVTRFTFDEGDLSGIAFASPIQSRIVLFDTTGKKSQVRAISNIVPATRTVTWNGADNFTVGLARVETREPRYTWLLTVRQSPTGFQAQVDVVVIFRRPDPPAGETHYKAQFRRPTTTIDGRTATVTYPTADEPALKKGGFILDAEHAHWYRIQDITRQAGVPSATETTATLKLHRPALADGNAAMVLEGVIEVFPLEPKNNIPLLDLLN